MTLINIESKNPSYLHGSMRRSSMAGLTNPNYPFLKLSKAFSNSPKTLKSKHHHPMSLSTTTTTTSSSRDPTPPEFEPLPGVDDPRRAVPGPGHGPEFPGPPVTPGPGRGPEFPVPPLPSPPKPDIPLPPRTVPPEVPPPTPPEFVPPETSPPPPETTPGRIVM